MGRFWKPHGIRHREDWNRKLLHALLPARGADWSGSRSCPRDRSRIFCRRDIFCYPLPAYLCQNRREHIRCGKQPCWLIPGSSLLTQGVP
jgi:hypothetical protein